MKRFVLICALLAAACAPDDSVTLYVTSADEALLRDGVEFINDPRLKLVVVANPMAKLGSSRDSGRFLRHHCPGLLPLGPVPVGRGSLHSGLRALRSERYTKQDSSLLRLR